MPTKTLENKCISSSCGHSHSRNLVEIAVPVPVFNTFLYRYPERYLKILTIGMRVLVPFGRRQLTGFIVGFPETEPQKQIKLKEIYDLLDDEPLFGESDLDFYRWTSSYYYYPIGQTIKTALPNGLNSEYTYIASITELGCAMLKKKSVKLSGLDVLYELAEGKEVLLKDLGRKSGRKDFNFNINSLKEKQLIKVGLKRKLPGVRVKKEKWFSAGNNSFEQTLKGRQKEIFTFIVEKGEISLNHIKQRFGNSLSPLKTLEKKGAVSVQQREVFRKPFLQEEIFPEPVHVLTSDQAKIVKQIEKAIQGNVFHPFLLHGVTGSGKTEIYLKVIEQVLERGGQCLYLVPEISLTAQLWDRINSRLRHDVVMLHSSLTDSERFDAWRMIRRGKVKVVIGARSAIFASFSKLGAIIVDEEHDASYKQDEKLRYNARDIALVKGQLTKAVVVLGSATPSLESYNNALKKKYFFGTLSNRVENRPLPNIKIIDMKKDENPKSKNKGIISYCLKKAIEKRLSDGEQTLLFLNRRGFAPAFLCQQCGYTFRCLNCDVSLIHHMGQKKLRCHYCDFSIHLPEECPDCGSYFLTPLGWGTERLEVEMKRFFPSARIARMDRDTTAARGAARSILKSVYHGDIDILIGTQMIAKGFHLPKITLVGVICADQSLNFPDYRASERTFQLLTQVAGRSGRGDIKGEVLIQAYNPDHYSIACARSHDYKKFFGLELQYRKELGYPPYKRIINLRFEGKDKPEVEGCAEKIGHLSRRLLDGSRTKGTVEILGPARAPWEKLKNQYRYHMILKGGNLQILRAFTTRVLEQAGEHAKQKGVKLIVDVDPMFML